MCIQRKGKQPFCFEDKQLFHLVPSVDNEHNLLDLIYLKVNLMEFNGIDSQINVLRIAALAASSARGQYKSECKIHVDFIIHYSWNKYSFHLVHEFEISYLDVEFTVANPSDCPISITLDSSEKVRWHPRLLPEEGLSSLQAVHSLFLQKLKPLGGKSYPIQQASAVGIYENTGRLKDD